MLFIWVYHFNLSINFSFKEEPGSPYKKGQRDLIEELHPILKPLKVILQSK